MDFFNFISGFISCRNSIRGSGAAEGDWLITTVEGENLNRKINISWKNIGFLCCPTKIRPTVNLYPWCFISLCLVVQDLEFFKIDVDFDKVLTGSSSESGTPSSSSVSIAVSPPRIALDCLHFTQGSLLGSSSNSSLSWGKENLQLFQRQTTDKEG